MEIILLEHVDRLGKLGDRVTVKSGYARNYLLPFKKALRATEANIAFYEKQKAELAANNAKMLEDAKSKSESLKGFSAVLIRQAAETGQLYGSVTMRDVASVIKDAGFDIERSQVQLNRPIKDLGIYEIDVKLHPEVSQRVYINIARTDEEAKRQEKAFNKE